MTLCMCPHPQNSEAQGMNLHVRKFLKSRLGGEGTRMECGMWPNQLTVLQTYKTAFWEGGGKGAAPGNFGNEESL